MTEDKSLPLPSSNTSGSTLANLSVDELLAKVMTLMKGDPPPDINEEKITSHVDVLCNKVLYGNIESGPAFDFLREIAEKGNARAQRYMGDCSVVGVGEIKRNFSAALEWYKKAAAQGDALADGKVKEGGKIPYLENYLPWMRLMAEKGNRRAQFLTADFYGYKDIPDCKAALEWYKKARDNGLITFRSYESNGCVVNINVNAMIQDTEERIEVERNWFKDTYDSATQPQQDEVSGISCFDIAGAYEHGVGVEKNLNSAYSFYKRAADLGIKEESILQKLEDLKEFCPAAQADKEVKQALDKLTTEEKNKEKQFYLGFCYENGISFKKDAKTAAQWYGLSAKHGYAQAQYHLGCCYEKGTGVQQNLISALEWYKKAADQKDPYAQKKLELPKFKALAKELEQRKKEIKNPPRAPNVAPEVRCGGTYWGQSYMVPRGKEQQERIEESEDLYDGPSLMSKRRGS